MEVRLVGEIIGVGIEDKMRLEKNLEYEWEWDLRWVRA